MPRLLLVLTDFCTVRKMLFSSHKRRDLMINLLLCLLSVSKVYWHPRSWNFFFLFLLFAILTFLISFVLFSPSQGQRPSLALWRARRSRLASWRGKTLRRRRPEACTQLSSLQMARFVQLGVVLPTLKLYIPQYQQQQQLQ